MNPLIIGDSVQGDSHARRGIERQDSYLIIDGIHKHDRKNSYYKELGSDVKIVAVADGHGSASCPHSKNGSQTAVNVFCDLMAEFAVKYKDDMQKLFQILNSEAEITRISKTIIAEWERRVIQYHTMKKREVPIREDGSYDINAIWKQYGTTLLGMLVTASFVFVFQLGDGDITYVDKESVSPVIIGDKILGVETHSISKPDSWKKAISRVVNLETIKETPFMYILSTDGWVNSHASEMDFHKTCTDYFLMIQEHGLEVVEKHLSQWLIETSAMGCGDDITTVFVYFGKE